MMNRTDSLPETVSIEDMMNCRDRRVSLQQEMLEKHHAPLISFCMNIPGPVKTNDAIRRAFNEGTELIYSALHEDEISILDVSEIHEKTGDELMLCVNADAANLKARMSRIEDTHPLGRLFDIDIINVDGTKLSRERYRKCLLCERQAQDCARARRHSADELFAKINEMLSRS